MAGLLGRRILVAHSYITNSSPPAIYIAGTKLHLPNSILRIIARPGGVGHCLLNTGALDLPTEFIVNRRLTEMSSSLNGSINSGVAGRCAKGSDSFQAMKSPICTVVTLLSPSSLVFTA